jgi:hypothetical protein
MRPTANMVPKMAADNCDQALLANYSVSHHNNPAWLHARASCRAIFHTYMSFNKPVPFAAMINLRVLRK